MLHDVIILDAVQCHSFLSPHKASRQQLDCPTSSLSTQCSHRRYRCLQICLSSSLFPFIYSFIPFFSPSLLHFLPPLPSLLCSFLTPAFYWFSPFCPFFFLSSFPFLPLSTLFSSRLPSLAFFLLSDGISCRPDWSQTLYILRLALK